jgi:hypothetical protein
LNDFGVKEEANKLLRPRYDSPKAESRIWLKVFKEEMKEESKEMQKIVLKDNEA